jgi:hypothetical protein
MSITDEREKIGNTKADWKTKSWAVVPLLASFFSGGAMGAFINHYYATRQTVVSYVLNTTSLGAGEATKSVLPSLRLQLDKTELPAVFTHTIEIAHASGPEVDKATISMTLKKAKLLGSPIAYGPDPLHLIGCKQAQNEVVICEIGRISPSNNNPYRIVIATDQSPQIDFAIDGNNIAIQHIDPIIRNKLSWSEDYSTILAGVFLGYLLISLTNYFMEKVAKRRNKSAIP